MGQSHRKDVCEVKWGIACTNLFSKVKQTKEYQMQLSDDQKRSFYLLLSNFHFCSLLPHRHKLLCCPSERVTECNNKIRALNELYQFWSDIPQSSRHPWRPRFPSEYFTEMLHSYISRPSKSGIVSNNRHSKLYVVIDCLFLKNASLKI